MESEPVRFPSLSPKVIFARVAAGGVVYDLISEILYPINATAAALCAACTEQLPIAETVEAWAAETGVLASRIRSDVDNALQDFSTRGWIGRSDRPRVYPPNAPPTAPDPGEASATLAAGSHHIVFRSPDESLVKDVLSVLALPEMDQRPTAEFRLTPRLGGGVTLHTDSEWRFPNRDELLERIIPIVNDFVARSSTDVVLHAAASISLSGQVVVLPSPPGSGKSTLVAGLVQRGWCYLTDESTTIRTGDFHVLPYVKPLDLDDRSRSVLGLDPRSDATTQVTDLGPSVCIQTQPTGPPSAIVLCNFVGDAGSADVSTLGFEEALVELVRNTLNLRYQRERGLETLVHVASDVPVHRISYASTAEAIRQLGALDIR